MTRERRPRTCAAPPTRCRAADRARDLPPPRRPPHTKGSAGARMTGRTSSRVASGERGRPDASEAPTRGESGTLAHGPTGNCFLFHRGTPVTSRSLQRFQACGRRARGRASSIRGVGRASSELGAEGSATSAGSRQFSSLPAGTVEPAATTCIQLAPRVPRASSARIALSPDHRRRAQPARRAAATHARRDRRPSGLVCYEAYSESAPASRAPPSRPPPRHHPRSRR